MPIFDVVNDYNWCINNKRNNPNALSNVPRIILTEYQQDQSDLIANINYWFQQTKDIVSNTSITTAKTFVENLANIDKMVPASNPYRSLYSAKPTGNTYTLPFYNSYHHGISQSWGENQGAVGDYVDRFLVPMAKKFMPAAGIESIYAWAGTQAATYNIEFSLLNTVNNSYIQNKSFIDQLIHSNLQERLNPVASLPPCIYEVNIPGVRISPAAVIANLEIINSGQINNIIGNDGNGENIPDEYLIRMNIIELIRESRLIYGSVKNPSKVKAVEEVNIEALRNAMEDAQRDMQEAPGRKATINSDPTDIG